MAKTRKLKKQKTFSWMNSKVEIRSTKKNGKGVFAVKNIRKDEILAMFGGYVMSLKEFDKLPEHLRHIPYQINSEFVFGKKKSNEIEDADFFNHSCDPNAGFKGHIFFVAMRKILKNEEITFDYAMDLSYSKTPTPKGKNAFRTMRCICGSKICRGKLTENDWKLPSLQSKYDGYFQWYLQEKINKIKNKK